MLRKFPTWLLLSAMFMACAGPLRKGGSVDVDFLWVKKAGEGRGWEGGMSHAVVKVEESDSGMHVGVFESKPAGTGNTWRVAVWIAALTGTLGVLENPLDFRFSVETETLSGRLDGPSAGGLFAVAMMAALRGAKISEVATMTGTTNPDGTVGPVGGLAYKLSAAHKAGKTRFCCPAGQRFEDDLLTGQPVDIQKLAEKLGVEVIEVEDLAQAYACLVASQLDRVKAVRRSQMALSGDTYKLMQERTDRWLTRSQEAYSMSRKLAEADKLEKFWVQAREEYDLAQAFLKEGLVAAAYWKAVSSYVSSRAVLLSAAMIAQLSEGDPAKALNVFPAIEKETNRQIDDAFAALAQVAPAGINATISLLDAYVAAISSVVSREFARAQYADILRKMKAELSAHQDFKAVLGLFAQLHTPLSEIALVEVNTQKALDSLELLRVQDDGKGTGLKRFEEVALLFQGAASANLEYFDSIFVREVAERTKEPMEKVSALLLDKEANYRVAQFNLKLPQSGKMGYAETGQAASMAKLAGALSSYVASSALVARFYSIGVKLDAHGNTVGVEREIALATSLRLAEQKARENAAMAMAHTGDIPASARISYQIALVLLEGESHQDKLDALEYFWRSSLWSQVAVYLTRLEPEEEKR